MSHRNFHHLKPMRRRKLVRRCALPFADTRQLPFETTRLRSLLAQRVPTSPVHEKVESYGVAKVVLNFGISVELARILAELANIGGASS